MIKSNAELDCDQLEHVQQLAAACEQFDGGTPTIYTRLLTKKRTPNSNLFFYKESSLVGFLSVYFFYHQGCEMTLLVHPNCRRQTIAKQLINSALPLLRSLAMEKIIFSASASTPITWLFDKGLRLESSDYTLERQSAAQLPLFKPLLKIRLAEAKDCDELAIIHARCFASDTELSKQRLYEIFGDSQYSIVCAELDGRVIGKAQVLWQSERVFFSDIAVWPKYQGQGYGGDIVSYCVNSALQMRRYTQRLDVETSNKKALNVYLNRGFVVVRKKLYFETSLTALERLVNA